MWKKFMEGYEINKDTCEIRSKDKEVIFGNSKRLRRGVIKKVHKTTGYVTIKSKAYRPEKVYLETFGTEFKTFA